MNAADRADMAEPNPSSPRQRVRLFALLTVLAMGASTAAFAVGITALGAVLGVAAGVTSALMVWAWIKSNSTR
jgi:hypothetical protein